MLSRSARRISSNSSASRSGIRNLVLSSGQGEDAVYASKTFDDGEASPSPGATPLSSRRSSMSAGFAARRESQTGRAPFAMTSMASESPTSASGRTISTTATASATALPGISPIPMDAASPNVNTPISPASLEHGSYEFTPKELAAVKKRVEEEFLLKKAISSSQSLAAQIRPSSKVPFEYSDADASSVVHPSGFVVPGPTSTGSHAPVASTLSEGESRQRWRPADASEGVREGVKSFEGLKGFDSFSTSTRRGKVPQEVLLADGSTVHSSGFVPPSQQDPGMENVKEMYKPALRAH